MSDHGDTAGSRAALHQRWAIAGTILACAAALALPMPPLELQVILVAFVVALLGFPHGALDPLVAALGFRWEGRPWVTRFIAGYLALAGATVLLWIVSPALGLGLFLVTSGVHFGLGDAPPRGPRGPARQTARVLGHGLAPILLPAVFHPVDVGTVFGWLTRSDGSAIAAWIEGSQGVLLASWVVIVALGYVGDDGAEGGDTAAPRSAPLVELAVLCLAFALMPPLLSFAVYFCGWHSARHLIAVDDALGRDLRARGAVVGLAVMAATGLLLGAAHVMSSDPSSVETAARTLFIGLAALTPPHMVVSTRLGARGVGATGG